MNFMNLIQNACEIIRKKKFQLLFNEMWLALIKMSIIQTQSSNIDRNKKKNKRIR